MAEQPTVNSGGTDVGERSVGGREYVLAFGPADPEVKQGFLQISVHQCSECAALVVEDFMADHMRWHERQSYRHGASV